MRAFADVRLNFLLLASLFYFGIDVSVQEAQGEPWLGTRYAQNCAGCHAPGRKNLQPKDRRCSLSCQGCHVNPSGGGLRSLYGKWNEDRWLASFKSYDTLKHAKNTKPITEQIYGKTPFEKTKPKEKKRVAKQGFVLKQTTEIDVDEKAYDRSDGLEKITAATEDEWLYQVPKNDPWRLMEASKYTAGGDLRWQLINKIDGAKDGEEKNKSFLMNMDFGIDYRPVYRNVHLVYESRFFGSPSKDREFGETISSAYTRSMYAMVDYLPYNIYFQYGYYRPLFGNYGPDHLSLPQKMISQALQESSTTGYKLLYETFSVGTAPNVPYGNIHVITKKAADATNKDTKGFALNLGLRFVTLGGALSYSLWRTDTNRDDGNIEIEMHSFTAAATIHGLVSTLEYVSISRNHRKNDFRRGGTVNLENYYQVWREMYLFAQYALGSTTPELLPGKTTQSKIGARLFLFPGVDVMFNYENEDVKAKEEEGGLSRKVSAYTGQLHLYF